MIYIYISYIYIYILYVGFKYHSFKSTYFKPIFEFTILETNVSFFPFSPRWEQPNILGFLMDAETHGFHKINDP